MTSFMRILYFQIPSENSKAFSEACLGLTPKVYSPTPEEVFLDISVTEKLFGGEARLLSLVENLQSSFGFKDETYRVLTDRPEWAKAFMVSPQVNVPPGES